MRGWAPAWLLALGALGLGTAPARAAGPADRPDAQMLLDLDLLRETDVTRDRAFLQRLRMLEQLRLLERLGVLESPTPPPPTKEVKQP